MRDESKIESFLKKEKEDAIRNNLRGWRFLPSGDGPDCWIKDETGDLAFTQDAIEAYENEYSIFGNQAGIKEKGK